MAQAEAAQQAALYNYQYSIQNAFADVDNALVANQKLKEQLAAQERLVDALKDYARLAKLQYDGGYTSLYDRAAGRAVAVPRRAAARVAARVGFSSSANIYKAMGGGWVVEADKMTGDTAPPPADRDTGFPPLF